MGSIPITLYINPAGAKYATVDITDPLSGAYCAMRSFGDRVRRGGHWNYRQSLRGIVPMRENWQ